MSLVFHCIRVWKREREGGGGKKERERIGERGGREQLQYQLFCC